MARNEFLRPARKGYECIEGNIVRFKNIAETRSYVGIKFAYSSKRKKKTVIAKNSDESSFRLINLIMRGA